VWGILAALRARVPALLEAERGRFFLWLPVFMAAGAALYFSLFAEPAAWIGAGLAVPAVLGVWLSRPLPWLRAGFLPVAAAAIGFLSAQSAALRAPKLEPLPARAVTVTGIVQAVELLPDGAQRVTLRAPKLHEDTPPITRDLRIRLRANDLARPETGDELSVRALLRPPGPPAYPGAWDMQREAFFTHRAGSGTALGTAWVRPRTEAAGPTRLLQQAREALARRFVAGMPAPAGAVSATLFTGLTAAIPQADRAAFRDSGLAHLLAVAGLHIGIIMGLFFGFTRVLLATSEHAALRWPCKQISAGAAIFAGALYMVITGMHVPIMRSFAMASLFTLAVIVGRPALSLRGLALAGVTILLVAPQELTGVSFQMSFSAVLALISGYEALRPTLHRLRGEGTWRGRLLVHVAMLALTSLLAGAASAPFGAYHFGHVQLYFVLANLVAVPLTAMWVMPFGLVAIALMPFGLEWIALAPMFWGMQGILWIAHTISALPAAVFAIPHMPLWGLLAFSLGLAWLGIWRTRWRVAGIAPMLLGLASPWLIQPADLLISAEARLIGVRVAEQAYVRVEAGASPFTLEAWQQYWAVGQTARLPANIPDRLACDDSICRLRAPVVLLLMRGETVPAAACTDAALIVAAVPLRGQCPGVPSIDRFTVLRQGAFAVWLDPAGVRVLSDRQDRGERPWVELPSRRRSELPPAATEILPPEE